jgi:hypothetical protein
VVWLRERQKHAGEEYDLESINGTVEDDGGVAHGRLLIKFAEAVLGGDDQELAEIRDRMAAELGSEALVDSAGVVALFNAIDRVADATGTPLEDVKVERTVDFREALGINNFYSAEGKI